LPLYKTSITFLSFSWAVQLGRAKPQKASAGFAVLPSPAIFFYLFYNSDCVLQSGVFSSWKFAKRPSIFVKDGRVRLTIVNNNQKI